MGPFSKGHFRFPYSCVTGKNRLTVKGGKKRKALREKFARSNFTFLLVHFKRRGGGILRLWGASISYVLLAMRLLKFVSFSSVGEGINSGMETIIKAQFCSCKLRQSLIWPVSECLRWKMVAFSRVYFQSASRLISGTFLLVKKTRGKRIKCDSNFFISAKKSS